MNSCVKAEFFLSGTVLYWIQDKSTRKKTILQKIKSVVLHTHLFGYRNALYTNVNLFCDNPKQ